MSRIGKKPISLPAKVAVECKGSRLTVKGPKGTLSLDVHPDMAIEATGSEVRVGRPTDNRRHRALHGMTRSLVQNLVTGVSEGFVRVLEIQGVGFRAALQGSKLTMSLGFSHPVEYDLPQDVAAEVKDQRVITLRGMDKQRVGQVAAIIRGFKPPEPYKGTGIRHAGERIVRKEGKAGAK
ncbi:MAG: 50S ribosomal protein L6 [Desulfuromonadales bacterium]|nr:50S ribosomal protein L6 [Desulfuromonadales bacterium]